MVAEQPRRIFAVNPFLHRFCLHEAVEALDELEGEIGLGIARVALAEERLPLQVGFLDHVGVDDRQVSDACTCEAGDH